MAHTSAPSKPSPAGTSSKPTTATPRSSWPRGSRRRAVAARSRCAQSRRIGKRPPRRDELRTAPPCDRVRQQRDHDSTTWRNSAASATEQEELIAQGDRIDLRLARGVIGGSGSLCERVLRSPGGREGSQGSRLI